MKVNKKNTFRMPHNAEFRLVPVRTETAVSYGLIENGGNFVSWKR